jgi:hypothetical protein
LKQPAYLVLPRQAANELIDVQRGIDGRQRAPVHAYQLHIGGDAHWIYHCDYTLSDLNPIPR